jgi:uncharacterized protein (TIGR02996 family)
MNAAFIQAIRDEPGNDLPRLVYADFLEDQGQSARAEFIRVQCELTSGVRDRGRRLELLRRLRALVVDHRGEWLGDLAAWAPDSIFERGFVDRVSLPAEAFLEHAAALFIAHPISRVALREASRAIPALAACRELAHLDGLDLRENNLSDAGAVGLASSPHLGRLTELSLTDNGIGSTGVRAMVARAHLCGLETLGLAGNHLRDGGVEALASSPNLPRLTRLDLSRNDVTDRGAELLAASAYLGSLTSLRLAYNRLTRAGIEALGGSPRLAGLTVLDVTGNDGVDRDTGAELRRRFGARLLY